MTFSKALELLKEGKKVTNGSFKRKGYLRLNTDDGLIKVHDVNGPVYTWWISNEEIMKEDWEEVQ